MALSMARNTRTLDYLTLAGVVLCLLTLVGGNWLEGGHADSLVQFTAFFIVVGGTIGAILVQTPLRLFLLALRRFQWVIIPPPPGNADTLGKITDWSRVVHKDGLLGLQKSAERESDKFIKKGLLLLVDGNEPEDIRKILEVEIASSNSRDLGAARVYEAMGGYAPAIGIIAAVIGLIQVLNNLTDPAALGPGIAAALVATVYGVGLANFFLLPIANKLKTLVDEHSNYQQMLADGIVSIAEGENPRVIRSQLEAYLG